VGDAGGDHAGIDALHREHGGQLQRLQLAERLDASVMDRLGLRVDGVGSGLRRGHLGHLDGRRTLRGGVVRGQRDGDRGGEQDGDGGAAGGAHGADGMPGGGEVRLPSRHAEGAVDAGSRGRGGRGGGGVGPAAAGRPCHARVAARVRAPRPRPGHDPG
ncbi:MAG: hypothetical protein ACK559_39960, partial [bacterium]